MTERMCVNGKEYTILRLLGKGKGGYSYLAEQEGQRCVVKQIHHEPCDYYQFGDKMEAELRDYGRLTQLGIPIPKMLDADRARERIVKAYIDGDTVFDLVKSGRMREDYIRQVKQMCARLYPAGLNIDYFPTNFILQDGILYYIDYECNDYSDEWNFENWGIRYWSKTEVFLKYLREHSQR